MSEIIVKHENAKKRKVEVPVTIDWKNAKMVRAHSIRAATKEILNMSKNLDVVKINIIGSPSTGKSTLADTLGHLCHTLADIPYTVKKFSRDDLLNFEATLSKLQPTNHVLIFDDVSFLTATASGKQIKQIEKALTEIRHLPGGQDVKIITIFNFHYNMAISKYMRQSEIFIYTSIGSSEFENTVNVIGKKYIQQISIFRACFQQATTKSIFNVPLGDKGKKFVYKYKQPFVPILFYNGLSARLVVFPKRDWIDKICSVCANSNATTSIMSGNVKEFEELFNTKYKRETLLQAMKIKLFILGASTYPKRVKQCMTEIDQAFMASTFDANAMAEHFGLIEKRTMVTDPIVKGKIWTGLG